MFKRFRREAVAITADVQQLFHCFVVKPEEFFDFFWYQDDDESKDVIVFRMSLATALLQPL